MDEDQVKVDAIVVGGGPAGLAAAYTLAQNEMEVIVVARLRRSQHDAEDVVTRDHALGEQTQEPCVDLPGASLGVPAAASRPA